MSEFWKRARLQLRLPSLYAHYWDLPELPCLILACIISHRHSSLHHDHTTSVYDTTLQQSDYVLHAMTTSLVSSASFKQMLNKVDLRSYTQYGAWCVVLYLLYWVTMCFIFVLCLWCSLVNFIWATTPSFLWGQQTFCTEIAHCFHGPSGVLFIRSYLVEHSSSSATALITDTRTVQVFAQGVIVTHNLILWLFRSCLAAPNLC